MPHLHVLVNTAEAGVDLAALVHVLQGAQHAVGLIQQCAQFIALRP